MSPTILWLAAGALFIMIEMFGVPGLGFLFIGIGALAVGGSIELGVIAQDAYLLQFVLFTLISGISAAILWNKLKSSRAPAYSNMVGTEGTVAEGGLSDRSEGLVKWSGTLMRAQLAEDAGVNRLAEGAVVIVCRVEGNLLFVAPKS